MPDHAFHRFVVGQTSLNRGKVIDSAFVPASVIFVVWLFSNSFPFADDRLARAIAATLELRESEIPAESPEALTRAFTEDEHKQRQWDAFLENVALHPGSLAHVIAGVARLVMPHAIAAAKVGSSH